MGDLQNPKWMYVKGLLFLLILGISIFIILLETRSWRIALLLGLIVWSSARLYYFMFYVIEKYVDPKFKFAGIFSFLGYMFKKRDRESGK